MKWEEARRDTALLGRRDVRPVDFPGAPHIKVGVRMLTETVLDGCRRRAHAKCEKDRSLGVLDQYQRALDREVICEAFVDLDTAGKEGKEPEPFFAEVEEVEQLDANVVTQLATLYDEHCREADPLVYLDTAQVEDTVKRLGKKLSSPVLLNGFEHATLVNLCAFLASQLPETSQPPSSTTGQS